MRALRALAALAALVVLCAGMCQAQDGNVERVAWAAGPAASIAAVDRRVLREDSRRFRPMMDNRDRIHLTVRFVGGVGRQVQHAAPASWGPAKVVDTVTAAAHTLGWPITRRWWTEAEGSIVCVVDASLRAGMSSHETIPWPALLSGLRSAGAGRVEVRLRSGLPIFTTGAMRGWEDCGSAVAELRALVVEANAAPPPPMGLTVGFTRGFILSRLLFALLVLFLGPAAVLGAYRSAVRAAVAGLPIRRQLGWMRAACHGFTIVWTGLLIAGGGLFFTVALPAPRAVVVALRILLLIVPPAALYLAGYLLRRRIPETAASREAMRPAYIAWCFAVIAVSGVALGFYMAMSGRSSSAASAFPLDVTLRWLLPTAIVLNVVLWTAVRLIRGRSYTLASGDLLDRCKELAARADVPLESVKVIDGKLVRANGFAAGNGGIIVTRTALLHLRKEEVDALIAHELAHIKLGHVDKQVKVVMGLIMPWSLVGAVLFISGRVWPAALVILIASPFALLPATPWMRRQEFEADAFAVELLGDARPVMRLLASITRINRTRFETAAVVDAISTHPSMARRVRVMAERFGVSAEEVGRIASEAGPAAVERGPLPLGERYDESPTASAVVVDAFAAQDTGAPTV